MAKYIYPAVFTLTLISQTTRYDLLVSLSFQETEDEELFIEDL